MDLTTEKLPDLGSAEAGEELTRYMGYPSLEEMIKFLNSRDENKIAELTPEALSINGTVRYEPMKDYLDNKAVNNSACKEVTKTALHYLYYVNERIPKEPKKAFDLGTFAHLAFLEPKVFDQVIVEPKANRASIEGVNTLLAFYYDALQNAEGSLITEDSLKAYEYIISDKAKLAEKKEALEKMIKLCPYQVIAEEHKIIVDILKENYYKYGNGIIPKLLKGAMFEASMYGCDADTGIAVKIRPDAIQFAENIGIDAVISFKTSSSDNIERFAYDTAKFKYELGEGMYQEVASDITGRSFKTTIMIMLQTVPPYLPAVFFWDPDDLENGKYQYRCALKTIKGCTDKNYFPGFDANAEEGHSGIIRMKQPDWAIKEKVTEE